jgi:hypothetical protein
MAFRLLTALASQCPGEQEHAAAPAVIVVLDDRSEEQIAEGSRRLGQVSTRALSPEARAACALGDTWS